MAARSPLTLLVSRPPYGMQEYERFDVDNDFEGGEFVDGEFYFQNKRRKRAQSKEDQLYGVFAENSGERRGSWGRPTGIGGCKVALVLCR